MALTDNLRNKRGQPLLFSPDKVDQAAIDAFVWPYKHKSRTAMAARDWFVDNAHNFMLDQMDFILPEMRRHLRWKSYLHHGSLDIIESKDGGRHEIMVVAKQWGYPVFYAAQPIDWPLYWTMYQMPVDFMKSFPCMYGLFDLHDRVTGMSWWSFCKMLIPHHDLRKGPGWCRKQITAMNHLDVREAILQHTKKRTEHEMV